MTFIGIVGYSINFLRRGVRWMWTTTWFLVFVTMLLINIATMTISGVAATMSTIWAALGDVQTVYSILTEKVEVKDAEIALKDATLAKRDAELKKKNAALLDAKADLTGKKADLAAKDAEIKKLKGHNLKLTGQLADNSVGERRVILKGKEVLLKDAVDSTVGIVTARTKSAAVLNSSSMAAESIPLVGITIIVAMTAYDLKMSCDTLKDLEELNIAMNPDAARDPDRTTVCAMQVPTVDELIQKIIASPGEVWQEAVDGFAAAGKAIPTWDDVKSGAGSVANVVVEGGVAAWDATKQGAADAGEAVLDYGSGAYIWSLDQLGTGATAVSDAVGGTIEYFWGDE